jgi:RHS repeat-associated protein
VPARFSDSLGTRFSFTSSEQGVPLTVDDAIGKRAYLTYDAAGNVTSRTDWLGRITTATYDQAGNRLSEKSARGDVTIHSYALNGLLLFTRDATGHQRNFGYDSNRNLVSEQDNFGRRKDRAYNALNQLTEVRDFPDGATEAKVTYKRDFRGNPLTMTDELNRLTKYEYDLAGQLKKTTFVDPLGGDKFTEHTYDALNRLASTKDERGHITTYQYQAGCGCSDRVTVVTDPLGHATTTTYDANGRRSSVTDANNHTTSYVYDVRGHLRETHYHDGTVVVDTYDPRGRRVMTEDQTHEITTFGYDDQGQLTSVTDPLGNVTAYGYDLDGNLTSVTDANNHTTTYEYDSVRRKKKRTLPLGQFETFTYDLPGNLIAHTDFRGKTTTMTYDRRNRMLTKVPDPSLGEASHSYIYTPTNMRLSSTDASGTTDYTYDRRDRMRTKVAAAGTLTYTYDAAGNLASIRSSNENGTDVEYTWDAANQLVSVTDNRVGGTTTAAYTPTRRPATLAQPNGIGLTYSYDALDRVTSMLWRQGTSPAFASWGYTHNNRGQRLSATDVTGRSAAYGYDAASRLTGETITGDPRGATFNGALSYVIDDAGNLLSRTSSLAAIAAATYSYNANDELASDTYDPNGNTTSADGHTYAYDFEDRLVSKDGGAVTITYDCDGNRVAKTVGGVTTRYLVDDLNPTAYLQALEEVVGGAVQTRYTYGTSLVSQTRSVSTTPATSYYGYDAHGNITFLTDATGAVTDSYDYGAWGILVASTGSTVNTRLFAGEELDPELGLINMRARQYMAAAGRFSTLDPWQGEARLPVSLNRYLYANGDPVNLLDPSGRSVAVETATIDILSAILTTGKIVVSGYIVGCAFGVALSAFDIIDNTNSVPVIWQWCAKGGKQNIDNEWVRDARLQPDPCAWLEALYKAARARGDSKLAQKLKTAQKALGCRGSSY